jgi:hypothetical protein
MVYHRAFEKSVSPAETFTINVTVQQTCAGRKMPRCSTSAFFNSFDSGN